MRLTALLCAVLLFPLRAAALSYLGPIYEVVGVDASGNCAIAEVERIYRGALGIASPGELLIGDYTAYKFSSGFFPNHDFYEFYVSRSPKIDEQTDYIAVNRKTLTPYLLMGDPTGWDKKAEKNPNISSNSHYAYELNIENLNAVILNENISIDDEKLKAYLKDLFPLIGAPTYQYVYFDRTSLHSCGLPDTKTCENDVVIAPGEVEQFFLDRGNSMYVVPLDNGAFHIIVLNWLYTTGDIVEWDFTLNANGTIELHDIRDVALNIGHPMEKPKY